MPKGKKHAGVSPLPQKTQQTLRAIRKAVPSAELLRCLAQLAIEDPSTMEKKLAALFENQSKSLEDKMVKALTDKISNLEIKMDKTFQASDDFLVG